jgi:D-serine deaminase-like pyridoxal phosphate-dependent protein
MGFPYSVAGLEDRLSPSLVIFREGVRANLEAMIALAGGVERLRPHVKTHKMPAVIRLLEARGITRHKCATMAEAEMVAQAGGTDVLVAYPLVGPNPARLARLAIAYPATTFRATVDSAESLDALAWACRELRAPVPISVLLDIDMGMGRTGIAPGEQAIALYHRIARTPGLEPGGLHAYDGHRTESDPDARRAAAAGAGERLGDLAHELEQQALPVPRLVLGGTPSFPVHAANPDSRVECSPGTCIFHDISYATRFPDLPFEPAAAVLTRVISRPAAHRLCLDVGYKAVAADAPPPRVRIAEMPDATYPVHSEEHLVVETADAAGFPIGTPLLAWPWHICPTCALHARGTVVEQGRVVDEWTVVARDRCLSV